MFLEGFKVLSYLSRNIKSKGVCKILIGKMEMHGRCIDKPKYLESIMILLRENYGIPMEESFGNDELRRINEY